MARTSLVSLLASARKVEQESVGRNRDEWELTLTVPVLTATNYDGRPSVVPILQCVCSSCDDCIVTNTYLLVVEQRIVTWGGRVSWSSCCILVSSLLGAS